jgi:hypothetical protein
MSGLLSGLKFVGKVGTSKCRMTMMMMGQRKGGGREG